MIAEILTDNLATTALALSVNLDSSSFSISYECFTFEIAVFCLTHSLIIA